MTPRSPRRLWLLALLALAVITLYGGQGCYRIGLYNGWDRSDGDLETGDGDVTPPDADADADGDGDGDADSDSDGDGDGDGDADADADGDGDGDGDADADGDGDGDGDGDADVDSDADAELDGDTETELDVTYVLLSPTTSPPSRRTSGALEAGTTSDRFWIFGGFDGAAQTGLYYYDTTDESWVHVPEGDAEAVRQGHMMGWEPGCQKLIIFGGASGAGGEMNDIRVFDPSTGEWSAPTVSGGPPDARCFATFVWVPHQGRFLLHGGSNALVTSFDADLWALELDATCENATWEALTPTGDIPTARSGACAAYDESRGVLVSHGGEVAGGTNGDLYELDVDSLVWSHVVPAGDLPGTLSFCATTFHADRGVMLVHGGQRGIVVIGGTHVYDPRARRWTEMSPAPSPGNRGDVTAVYSPHLGQGLTFGGRYTNLGGLVSVYVDETWRVLIDAL